MIIVIAGPTGVGKTKLSIELAKKYNAEIINADSVQVYKKIDIASAKVTEEEKEGIPHHLFDIKEYDEDYTVYDYQIDARRVLNNLLNKNKNAIIVGGTGLYIKALLYDYRFNKEEDSHKYDNLTNSELLDKIYKINPNSMVDKNNNRRLIRELINLENNAENKTGDNLLYDNVYFIGLTVDRSILYDRINRRVDIMLEKGLIEEVKQLYKKYGDELRTSVQGIGYKEVIDYLNGMYSKEEMIEKIKMETRRYAKRQLTWFRKIPNIIWIDGLGNVQDNVNLILQEAELNEN